METMIKGQLTVQDLGLTPYQEAYTYQQQMVEAVIRGKEECLLVCEHPPVLTLGRMTKGGSILNPESVLREQGIDAVSVNRGGDVTLHAPGQIVLYPIFRLDRYKKDLKYYLQKLEEVIIDFLGEFDILACRIAGRTGVWVGERKIASIGIGVRKWVTFHGLAINVSTDLKLFSLIRPCGLDVTMTSVENITGSRVDIGAAKLLLTEIFRKHLEDY